MTTEHQVINLESLEEVLNGNLVEGEQALLLNGLITITQVRDDKPLYEQFRYFGDIRLTKAENDLGPPWDWYLVTGGLTETVFQLALATTRKEWQFGEDNFPYGKKREFLHAPARNFGENAQVRLYALNIKKE